MTIVRQRLYAPADMETISRSSEFRPTYFKAGSEGHTYSRHIAITRAEMADRGTKIAKRGGNPLIAVTAFITNDDAFRAGAQLLNTRVAQSALGDFDSGHTGMRAVMTVLLNPPTRVRYLTGGDEVKTMPSYWFRMIVDRNEVLPYGIHLQTFFPLLSDADLKDNAIIVAKDGRPWKKPPT